MLHFLGLLPLLVQCSVFFCVPLSTHAFMRLTHSVINILYLAFCILINLIVPETGVIALHLHR